MSEPLAGARVLVTGATGFLGRALVPALVALGAEVHALTRDPGAADLPAAVRVHAGDLSDLASIAGAVRASAPVMVFHLAAARGERTAEQRRALWEVNALGTAELLEACVQAGCERFVHAGSSLEYGRESVPFRESMALRPYTLFGASKAAATAAVAAVGTGGRLHTVNLRIFSVYGPSEPSSRLVPSAVRCALSGTILPLTPPGPVHDFVYISDVCDALVRAAVASDLTSGEVFNVGTGVQTSNEQLIEAVERATGRPVATDVGAYAPHPADRSVWCADTRHTGEVLGWEAATSLDAGLGLYVAHVVAGAGGTHA